MLACILLVVGAASANGCCDCAELAQLVDGLRQENARLQAENRALRDGEEPLASVRRTSDTVQANPCKAAWTLASDADAEVLEGCRTVHNLEIVGNITSLRSLRSLTVVKQLNISGTELESLAGLESLKRVRKLLTIAHNPRLSSLSSLESLVTVEGMSIEDNAGLESLMGLDKIQTLGILNITRNPSLASLLGLQSLESAETIAIDGNDELESLVGLENLKQVTIALRIMHNPSLTSLLNLSSLQNARVEKPADAKLSIFIDHNAALESLTGLDKIQSVLFLRIMGNPSLASLSGLQNLESIYSIDIEANPYLESLAGLGNSTIVSHKLAFVGNERLSSLSGAENLRGPDSPSSAGVHRLTEIFLRISLPTLVVRENPKLLSLSGLQHFRFVSSVSIVGNAKLDSLAGLENLTEAGALVIEGNPNLLSPLRLQGLRDVNRIEIRANAKLESLTGLEHLTKAGAVEIRNNSALLSLSGLQGMQRIDASFNIIGNEQLATLTGAEHLSGVNAMTIADNPSLVSLSGVFTSITEVSVSVTISDNLRLESLSGMFPSNLTRLDRLIVRQNTALLSLSGMFKSPTTMASITVSDNPSLQSLSGVLPEKLTGLRQLVIERNAQLKSLSGLESLRTAGDILLVDNGRPEQYWGTFDLSGLDNLESVSGEMRITGHGLSAWALVRERSPALGSLRSVGTLRLHDLAVEYLTALHNLAYVWSSLHISSCSRLGTLHGLGPLQRLARLVIEDTPKLNFLGQPLDEGASVGEVRIDEASIPKCMTPHERGALLLDKASSVPNITWRWQRDGGCNRDDLGEFTCTQGHPCILSGLSFDWLGNLSNTPLVRLFVSGPTTTCGPCSEQHPQFPVTVGGVFITKVNFSRVFTNEEAGLRSVCVCVAGGGTIAGPVAQLLLRGPQSLVDVVDCSKGQNCTLRLNGKLERTDRIVLMSDCTTGDPRLNSSFVVSWAAENTALLHNPATWYRAFPGRYQVCWRARCSFAPDGDVCPDPEDQYFSVGQLELSGPYLRDYSRVLGEDLWVPNIGFRVSDGDRMRLRRECGKANENVTQPLEAIASRSIFAFGELTVAGRHRLCWCQERDGTDCSVEEQFLADAGEVGVSCPAGQELRDNSRCEKCPAGKEQLNAGLEPCLRCSTGKFSGGGSGRCEACPDGTIAERTGSAACVSCRAWESADPEASGCSADPTVLVMVASFVSSVGAFCSTLVHTTRRRLNVVDVSLDHHRTFVTTFRSHGLANRGRRSFPVAFHGTCHPGLDSPSERLRARVKDASRLELLTWGGESINRRLDTSMGTLTVGFPHDCLHQGGPVPMAVSLPVFLVAAVALGAVLLDTGTTAQILMLAAGVALVFTLTSLAVRWRPLTTKLARRLAEFKAKVKEKTPCTRSAKGPDRALAVGKLIDLLESFQDFIRDRTAYYLDGNIIQPLTKADQVSYAEFVGPGQVEWFVSHFWGTPFGHFCLALQKHAETVHGTQSWKFLRYWVCFCSNNQHKLQNEIGLGSGGAQSSFFLALRSGHCQGTCMVLDDEAKPLARVWCIFELLQTIQLQHSSPNFRGLLLCTSSGVLNTGSGSVEVAMALAKKVAVIDLACAEASSERDAQMIREQVIAELGSYTALNLFIRKEVRTMLESAQCSANQQFDAVFELLE